jgi:hypothetical protein
MLLARCSNYENKHFPTMHFPSLGKLQYARSYRTEPSILLPSFFIAPLSRVTAIVCALFPKKPGGIPLARSNHFPLRHPFSLRYSPLATALMSFISPRYENSPRKSFPSPTYAKTGGWHPQKNVGAPTFSIFPVIFYTFSVPRRGVAQFRRRRRSKRAGPVEASGAQRARLKDQRYISEFGK